MKVIATAGREDIARVFLLEFGAGRFAECVESVQPPLPRDKKWVLIVSTLFGCPVGCLMCDAGANYQGILTREEIFDQTDFLITRRFPDGRIPVEKFKIQFARCGEPSFNPHVLEALEELPDRYDAPGLMPSLSTVAPRGTDSFFERLLGIKQARYRDGRFQMQFSIHTSDEDRRDEIIPVKKWSFGEIAEYGRRFHEAGDRKIALNFALASGSPFEAAALREHFAPDVFLIKLTPINPTHQARRNGLSSGVPWREGREEFEIVGTLRKAGYEVIVSIGEWEENLIGSNCGQLVLKHLTTGEPLGNGYTYPLDPATAGT